MGYVPVAVYGPRMWPPQRTPSNWGPTQLHPQIPRQTEAPRNSTELRGAIRIV